MAGEKGLEPLTFCLTGKRSNQLSYTPNKMWIFLNLIILIIKSCLYYAIVIVSTKSSIFYYYCLPLLIYSVC